MLQNRSIEQIIRRVEHNYKPVSSSDKFIVFDRKKGEILSKNPFFKGIGSKIEFYSISTGGHNTGERNGLSYRFLDFSSSTEIEILIDYVVSCSADLNKIKKVINTICNGRSPVAELDEYILTWTAEAISGKTSEFIENFSSATKQIAKTLKSRAESELGLSLESRIRIADESGLNNARKQQIINSNRIKAFSPPGGFIPLTGIKLSDYDHDLSFQMTIVMEVDESNIELAAENFGFEPLLINLVKEKSRRYFLEKVTLHQAYKNLQTTITQDLKRELAPVLANKGRRIGLLSLSSDSISDIADSLKLNDQEFLEDPDFEVSCRIRGYEKSIQVINTLQLILNDLGKFVAAVANDQLPLNKESGKPDLKEWSRKKLAAIIKPLLLEKNYVDILLDFESTTISSVNDSVDNVNLGPRKYADKLRLELEKAAELIGYSVRHIVSIPDLEPFKLKDDCPLETGEKKYPTRDSNVEVKLNIASVVKVSNLKLISKERLTPERPLQNQMLDTIYEAVRQYMNGIEPERFYMRFLSNDPDLGEAKSVEEELIDIVKSKLEEIYHATVSSVIPKIVNTDIISLFSDLRSQKGKFFIETNSLSGGEMVKFEGNFYVLNVERDSWYRFQSKFQTKIESRTLLLENVSKLNTRGSKIIAHEDSQDEFEETSEKIDYIRRQACGISEIEDAITRNLRAKLETLGDNDLQYASYDDLTMIENIFNEWVNNPQDRGSILSQFGLKISIFSLARSRTDLESKRAETRQKLQLDEVGGSALHLQARSEYIERLQKERDKLYDMRLKLIGVEGSEEELEKINTQIASIEQEILTPSLEIADQKLKKIEPAKKKTSGFRDIAKQMNLPESKPKSLAESHQEQDEDPRD